MVISSEIILASVKIFQFSHSIGCISGQPAHSTGKSVLLERKIESLVSIKEIRHNHGQPPNRLPRLLFHVNHRNHIEIVSEPF